MMKSIHLIAVNYHTYELAASFIRSVDEAAAHCTKFKVKITIADNDATSSWKAPITKHIECEVVAIAENAGYLGAAQRVWNAMDDKAQYDYVSISNVDLELAANFFQTLECYKPLDNCGWIAPDIYTSCTQNHENPFMATRPTRINFTIWKIIYSNTAVYRMYENLSAWRKRKSRHVEQQCVIYAGHGSFMLFTEYFIKQNPGIKFPGFMYCEELFFAELVRDSKAITIYAPQLRINNVGNASTGSINQRKKSSWSLSSLKAIEKLWF